MAAKLKKYLKGFTLIELIIVIAIIAVLGATAFLLLTQWMSKGRDASKLSSIRTIKTALEINFTSKGDYPIPEDAVEHTGANGITLYQGYVGANMIPELQKSPIDPSTKKPYVYSYMKLNGGQGYYQIGTTLENTVGYNGYELAKADIVQTAKLIGNYEFDPSLPSLIIAGGNESTRGIYDPSTCFVIDGGKNTVDGTQCQPKKELSLKDFDNGLVGYWDMESLTDDGKLMDVSGNENHGVNTGTTSFPILTGALVGTGIHITGALLVGSDLEIDFVDEISIVALSNLFQFNNPYPRLFHNRHFVFSYMHSTDFLNDPMYSGNVNNSNLPNQGDFAFGGLIQSSTGHSLNYNYDNKLGITGTGNALRFTDTRPSNTINLNNYYLLSLTFNKNTIKTYVNGKLVSQTVADKFNFQRFTTNVSSKYIFIGGSSGTNRTRDFNGIIDEVKIYNRALSEAEILQQAKSAGF